MHAIPHSPHFDILRRGEKVFLEAWFNLTHDRSLDSYRVRCHNGRTILEELHREMGMAMADPEDLGTIAAEAKEICGADSVLAELLGASWPVLRSLLETDPKNKKEKPDLSGERQQQLTYVLDDILSSLAPLYLKKALTRLDAAIDADKVEEIVQLSDTVATDLCARGWAVASLHAWIKSSFLSPARQNIQFMERFRFFSNRVQQETEKYTVTLMLSGGKALKELKEFAGFEFSSEPPADGPDNPGAAQSLAKFLQPNPLRVYASTQIRAVDLFSAAHEALEDFARCQDRLRFNYCDQPIVREGQRVLIRREQDQKRKVIPIVYGIPDAEHNLPLSKFLEDHERLDTIFGAKDLDRNTKRRIEAAFRHYRLGMDGGAYPDKLLNWWMGLETLTNMGNGKGGIFGRVSFRAIPLLCHYYFQTQLLTLARVVHMACDKKWPAEVVTLLGADLEQNPFVTWKQMVKILQDTLAANAVAAALARHPLVELRWTRFIGLAREPAKLLAHLNAHETRLTWHLRRLHNIRCCLVHGTPVEIPLQVPAANLEYYLREAIDRVLRALGDARNLHSLEAVFERTLYCNQRRLHLLSTKPTGTPFEAVLHALDTDLVFTLSN
jgi:hypothetical protein